jgi:hypothetical protein
VHVQNQDRPARGYGQTVERDKFAPRAGLGETAANAVLHKKIILHEKERSAKGRRDTAGTLAYRLTAKPLK